MAIRRHRHGYGYGRPDFICAGAWRGAAFAARARRRIPHPQQACHSKPEVRIDARTAGLGRVRVRVRG